MIMKILGVITARGGSKSIPRKNIKELCGKPLIAWTIEAAKQSGVFDRVILSTDDEEIAAVGKRWGAEVPFMRPQELAQDTTPHLPVMQHAVKWLKEHEEYEPDFVCILQPTAPLRQAWHLREAVELLEKTGADSVVSMVEIPGHYSPYWAVKIDERGLGTLLVSGNPIRTRILRRQSLPKAYTHSGAIYLFRTALLFDPAEPNFYGDKVAAYVMEDKYNVNIDDPADWVLAEQAMEKLRNEVG